MHKQWPREWDKSIQQSRVDVFRQLVDTFDKELLLIADEITPWIIQQESELVEFQQIIEKSCENTSLSSFPDIQNLLMTWICADALARAPLLSTWEKIRKFKYHSAHIEHNLGHAILLHAEIYLDTRDAYVTLSMDVLNAICNGTVQSQSERRNKEWANALSHWNKHHNKLEEIWWGLRFRDADVLSYREESTLFHVLNELSIDKFIEIVGQQKNPFFINAALFWSGSGGIGGDSSFGQFSQWQRLASDAPIAFDVSGKWNGSILLPLLLTSARAHLLEARHHARRSFTADDDESQFKQKIAELTETVVTVLGKRPDAPALFARWSTWLMRNLIGFSQEQIRDSNSRGYIEDALLEAIGRQLSNEPQHVLEVCPDDAFRWEIWCYRCVLAYYAHNHFIDELPNNDEFINEWTLSSDDWSTIKGNQLRERAQIFTSLSFNKELPSVAGHLLAHPFAQSKDAANLWGKMWSAAQVLRDIVEFGDTDIKESDEYRSRSEAGNLLLLLFNLGLAILDQQAVQGKDNNTREARSLVILHSKLAAAINEMREIDNTLNGQRWFAALQHLAIRRLVWEDRTYNKKKQGFFPVFHIEDSPTFRDYLDLVKSDDIELFQLLTSVLRNEPDVEYLQKQLRSSEIDISEIIHTLKRLHKYGPRKYPIDETWLQQIEILQNTMNERHS